MRKHKQIHTLDTPHYKVHFVPLRKLEDFKCALWSKNYGTLEFKETNQYFKPKKTGGLFFTKNDFF